MPPTQTVTAQDTSNSSKRDGPRWTLLPTRRRAIVLASLAIVIAIGGAYMFAMPGSSHSGALPPISKEEAQLSARLRGHVEQLATTIGPRHVDAPLELEAAATYIEEQFRALGASPERETFDVGEVTVANVVVTIEGATRPHEIIVVGAHYDSIPFCPAANDNASGVAGLLELTRALVAAAPARTLRLVAFVNEEPPWFHTEAMGSLVHAQRSRARGDDIRAMLSLETIGCYRDEPGSQQYPPPLNLLYPDTGNFIGFVGDTGSRDLVRRVVASFRSHTAFPSEGAAAPASLPGIGWSDHWAFWQHDYAALMVTDTAPFRYPHYHEETDTADRLDYDRMARVVSGVTRVVAELLNVDE